MINKFVAFSSIIILLAGCKTAEQMGRSIDAALATSQADTQSEEVQVASNDASIGAPTKAVPASLNTRVVKPIPYEGLKKIVAVSRFENRTAFTSGGFANIGTGLATQLTDALVQSGAFVVLERETLTDVFSEQNLARSGRMSRSQSARTGKATSAQVLVKGTVTEFKMNRSGNDTGFAIGGFMFGGGQSETHIGLVIRLIDTTTGQVIASHRVEGKAQGTSSNVGIAFGGLAFQSKDRQEDPISKATQIAIDRGVEFIAQRLRSVPFRARVVAASNNEVIVSAGLRNGAKPGDVFTVYGVGRELKDPYTGEILGREEREVGRLEVTTVKPRYAYTRPIGSFPLKVGDFIQYKRVDRFHQGV